MANQGLESVKDYFFDWFFSIMASCSDLLQTQQIQKIMNDKNISEVWIGLFSDLWEWSDQNNLILIQMNLSWSEALRYCRENHVDLVSVDSEEIQFMVTKVIHQSSTDAVWMGLHYYCQMNLWIWIRGEAVCYQNWASGNETKLMNCNTEHRAGAVQSGGDHHTAPLQGHLGKRLGTGALAQQSVARSASPGGRIKHSQTRFGCPGVVGTSGSDDRSRTLPKLPLLLPRPGSRAGANFRRGSAHHKLLLKRATDLLVNGASSVLPVNPRLTHAFLSKMSQTLYFSVLLIALCSLSECIQHRYHHINKKMTWTEAQKYCRENYTDLATVNNINDMNQLMKSVNNSQTIVWIGLKRSGVWKWSLGDPVKYTNWSNVDSNGPDDCVYMRDGSWHHQSCNMKMSFICYNESSKGFIINDSSVSWRAAQIFCRQHHTDLTSVRNQTENQQIQKIMNDKNINEVWIGLFSDSWEWSDKSESGFRYWMSGWPTASVSSLCTWIRMINPGQWTNVACSNSQTFVCHEDNLILIQMNLSWSEALRYCRENHVDLVSVDSEEIQFMVAKVIHRSSTDAVWMGLHYYCQMNLWIWIRGEVVCYQNWAPGNEAKLMDCNTEHRSGAVQSGGDHLWISLPQSHKLNFICSRK
ncbi:macrophage mannose receptor 1-like [Misgurnus anguillicaudatus]|uniref:macrophage mannose receptor 1-like n=1 Tax=Misgurnus anguillicaudatus TaxID=75329 RepID=UPI003CCF4556